MTRLIKEQHLPLLAANAVLLERICWDDYDISSPETMRKTRPVKRGDVVKFSNGRREIQEGLVLYAGAQWQRYRCEFCSFYNVAIKTKSDAWSKNWIRIYDGHIEKAYLEQNGERVGNE